MSEETVRRGAWGEKIIAEFFDSQFSRQFSFPNPRTRSNVEIADVFVWWNRVVFLIEVKTRDCGGKTVEQWASSRIREAVKQLQRNHALLERSETVNLHNEYYELPFIHDGIGAIFGLIVLVTDEPFCVLPEEACPDIYRQGFPIHVFSWHDLKRMTAEIDTVADLAYYLEDRQQLLQRGDGIPVGRELHAVATYKMGRNHFPQPLPDLSGQDLWSEYRRGMAMQIASRDADSRYAELYDHIADLLPDHRRLHDGIPIGLHFAWELGSLTRRERALWGREFASVEECFQEGRNRPRKFAMFSQTTGNWMLLFWSKEDAAAILKRLVRLVELKLIKEAELCGFEHDVYGLGFEVPRSVPPTFKLVGATFGDASIIGGYSADDVAEAFRELGNKSYTSKRKIEEFPND